MFSNLLHKCNLFTSLKTFRGTYLHFYCISLSECRNIYVMSDHILFHIKQFVIQFLTKHIMLCILPENFKLETFLYLTIKWLLMNNNIILHIIVHLFWLSVPWVRDVRLNYLGQFPGIVKCNYIVLLNYHIINIM